MTVRLAADTRAPERPAGGKLEDAELDVVEQQLPLTDLDEDDEKSCPDSS